MADLLKDLYPSGREVPVSGRYEVAGFSPEGKCIPEDELRDLHQGEIFPFYDGREVFWHLIHSKVTWVTGYSAISREAGSVPGTQAAHYSLCHLAERGYLDRSAVKQMLTGSMLSDFHWHQVWADDHFTSDDELPERIGNVDGYVVFLHGWTGSSAIWEDLPAMVAASNPRLVSLIVDHNGFGKTPFATPVPDFAHCSPIGAMRAAERWIELLGLRTHRGDPTPKTINLIGHSMGGAALFFAQESNWRLGELTRLAIAPALLLHDDVRRTFYTALGRGMDLGGRSPVLERIEDIVSPRIIEVLAAGASQAVIREHHRIFKSTPRSVTARTLAAMGTIKEHPQSSAWDDMHVILGHRDLLVGPIEMMDLLQELDFPVAQIRVVMGTHYLFSLGNEMRKVHVQNRQLVLKDIMMLHEQGLRHQREESM
jgi:pimeloyl-ACP methyl ester carboxylesterase